MGIEADLEADLREFIDMLGGLSYKFTSPNRKGVPDRIWLFNREFWGMVEMKAPGGRLEPWQQREHERLRGKGIRVDVIWNEDQLLDFMTEIEQEWKRGQT